MLSDIREALLQRSAENVLRILGGEKYSPGAVDKLCKVFGHPSVALEAGEQAIGDISSCGENEAFALSMTLPVARYMLKEAAEETTQVTNIEHARQKLLALYLGTHYECGHMLCLDRCGNFISCLPLRTGSVDETPFYLRIIIGEALISGGECFILAHNHPGGTRYPSAEDCAGTRSVMEAMSRLKMILIDHIILADGEAVSIRATNSIERNIWDTLAPLPEDFADWPR